MAITESTELGGGRIWVSVNHDPRAVATDALLGSIIYEETTRRIYVKLDDGLTTNVRLLDNIQRRFFENMSSVAFVFSEFLEVPGGLQVDGLQAIGGAGGFVSTPTAAYDFTNHPGVWGLNTGTSAAGRIFVLSQIPGGFHVGVGGITRHGCYYQSPAVASIAANRYVLRSGFSSITLPNTILQAVTFEAQDDENGGRWQAICHDGAETSVDTGVTVGTGKYVFLEFEVNAAGTSVEFFIDGVSVATIVTNIPSGTGFEHFTSLQIMKITGTANRAAYVDAYYFYQELTR